MSDDEPGMPWIQTYGYRQQAGNQNEQEDRWDCEKHIHRSHENLIDNAAVVSSEHADRGSNCYEERYRQKGHAEGNSTAPHQPGQCIAPQLVSAKPVRSTCPAEDIRQILTVGVIMRNESRDRRRS